MKENTKDIAHKMKMEKKVKSIDQELGIDPDALDVEWLNQPRVFMKYSEMVAQAKLEVDMAKEDLDVVKAELDRDIRSNPEAFGIAKIVEAVVTNTIILQVKYAEANTILFQAKYKAEILASAVKAFDQRKKALENLVTLFGQSYFAGPKEPRNLGLEFDKNVKRKEANRRIKKELNK